jgi:Bardet-Biedl syndrome 5 protein
METKATEVIWEDREVRFDSKPSLLSCRRGEKVIDSINSVEDTKGNNGERGSLVITNLRMLWISHSNSKINLSIGLNTIVTLNIRKAKSKLRGQTQVCNLSDFIFIL